MPGFKVLITYSSEISNGSATQERFGREYYRVITAPSSAAAALEALSELLSPARRTSPSSEVVTGVSTLAVSDHIPVELLTVTSHGPHRRSDGSGVRPRVHVLHTGCSTVYEAIRVAAAWAGTAAAATVRDYQRATSVYVALADTSYAGEAFLDGSGAGIGYVGDEDDLPSGWRLLEPPPGWEDRALERAPRE
jgi:hypothetical protein